MPVQINNSSCLRSVALLVVTAYTVVAAVWMLGAFLTSAAANMEQLIQARIIKDSLFIFITSAGLYSTIHWMLRRFNHSDRALQAERALRQSNDHLRSVVYHSPVAILTTDAEGIVTTWNRAAEQLFGWSEVEAHGAADPSVPVDQREEARVHRQRVLRGERLTDIEVRRLCKDSTPLNISLSAAPLYGEKETISSIILFCTDVTERKQQAERVQHLATHDPLTNLPNRRILEDHLTRLVERAKRGQSGALFMLDLDNFKAINDQLGHVLGDQYLIHIARVLEGTLRAGDVLTRFGGDEFAMLLDNVSMPEAEAIAERVRATLSASRFVHGQKNYDTSVSIGVAAVTDQTDAQHVLVMADTALLIAKDQGKNRVIAHKPGNELLTKLTESSHWATRIKDALRENRFVLYYQPVVRIATGEPEHFEVLIRMQDRDGKIIAPGAFIQAAEQFGLMSRVDKWVVERVLDTLAAKPDIRLFVNLSGTSLADHILLRHIEERVRKAALVPGRLVFEITETAAVTDLHHAQQWMVRLSELGCEFALDDFGVAFSSFAYLRELPVQYVKLDGSFVKNLDRDGCDKAMVQALNTVAHSLGKKVVAEWVENQRVAEVLQEIGTEFGQGYYWGRPTPEPVTAVTMKEAAAA